MHEGLVVETAGDLAPGNGVRVRLHARDTVLRLFGVQVLERNKSVGDWHHCTFFLSIISLLTALRRSLVSYTKRKD